MCTARLAFVATKGRTDASAHRHAAQVHLAGGGKLGDRVADAAGDRAGEHPAAERSGYLAAELAGERAGDLPADRPADATGDALQRTAAERSERVTPVVDVALRGVLGEVDDGRRADHTGDRSGAGGGRRTGDAGQDRTTYGDRLDDRVLMVLHPFLGRVVRVLDFRGDLFHHPHGLRGDRLTRLLDLVV